MNSDSNEFLKSHARPLDPALFIELHKDIGIALWQCQMLEQQMQGFIALVLKLPPSRAQAEVDAVVERVQRQTMGALLNELRKANSSTSVSELERRFNAFLKHRNWLVHDSWREHHTDLFTPEKMPPLLSRLHNIAGEARALAKFLSEMVTAWMMAITGKTREEIDIATLDYMRQQGSAD